DTLSTRALAARADALAAWLARRGVAPGQVVAAHLANGPDLAALLHATDRCDAILLPLNRRHTESELAEALRNAGARLLLHDGAAPRGEWEVERLPPPEAPLAGPPPRPARDASAPALLLYTSGTTGRAKGALLSHANLRASVEASARHLGAADDDRWLACLPLFHVGGLMILLRCAWQGVPAIVHEGFDAAAVSRALDEDGITHVSLVPTMLARLLEARGERRAPAGLRVALLGGAGASQELLERADKLGWPIAATYGLTEAASQVATRRPGAATDAPLEALPGTELRIVDASGAACAAGETGEILVRGATVTPGYWRDAAATARALKDGWLHTGDLGALDACGRLRVFDRRADLILSGGENVYPAEIEAVLSLHPEVAEAGVAGAPDPEFGARPVAWITRRAAHTPSAASLRSFCRARLAGFKVPVRFHVVRELPRTASGKLQRHRLVEPTPEEPA
ncbi:MAG: o-succinylbenzoate--CoA ligase, partial [Myxococcales bacterium]|nr:o-succinylbenzoate--CoA ligase [Myxococcales bacterium]